MSGHTSERSEPYQRFYINTECSKDGMVSLLLQAEESVKAIIVEAKEKVVKSSILISPCSYQEGIFFH